MAKHFIHVGNESSCHFKKWSFLLWLFPKTSMHPCGWNHPCSENDAVLVNVLMILISFSHHHEPHHVQHLPLEKHGLVGNTMGCMDPNNKRRSSLQDTVVQHWVQLLLHCLHVWQCLLADESVWALHFGVWHNLLCSSNPNDGKTKSLLALFAPDTPQHSTTTRFNMCSVWLNRHHLLHSSQHKSFVNKTWAPTKHSTFQEQWLHCHQKFAAWHQASAWQQGNAKDSTSALCMLVMKVTKQLRQHAWMSQAKSRLVAAAPWQTQHWCMNTQNWRALSPNMTQQRFCNPFCNLMMEHVNLQNCLLTQKATLGGKLGQEQCQWVQRRPLSTIPFNQWCAQAVHLCLHEILLLEICGCGQESNQCQQCKNQTWRNIEQSALEQFVIEQCLLLAVNNLFSVFICDQSHQNKSPAIQRSRQQSISTDDQECFLPLTPHTISTQKVFAELLPIVLAFVQALAKKVAPVTICNSFFFLHFWHCELPLLPFPSLTICWVDTVCLCIEFISFTGLGTMCQPQLGIVKIHCWLIKWIHLANQWVIVVMQAIAAQVAGESRQKVTKLQTDKSENVTRISFLSNWTHSAMKWHAHKHWLWAHHLKNRNLLEGVFEFSIASGGCPTIPSEIDRHCNEKQGISMNSHKHFHFSWQSQSCKSCQAVMCSISRHSFVECIQHVFACQTAEWNPKLECNQLVSEMAVLCSTLSEIAANTGLLSNLKFS